MHDARRLAPAVAAWDEHAASRAVDRVRSRPALARAAVGWDAALAARRVDVVLVAALLLGAAHRSRRPGPAHGVEHGATADGSRSPGAPSPRALVVAALTVLAGWAAQAAAKAAIRRPRPPLGSGAPLVRTPGSSTPSGHVANLTTAALVVHDVAAHAGVPRTARRALAAALATLVAVTALDRVAVGAHRPSDVAAGAALGTIVHAACARILGPRGRRRGRHRGRAPAAARRTAPSTLSETP